MGSLLIGFSLGFFVAAQIGPISLLVMRTVLGGALSAGLAIGAGAAVIDALYAALGQAGAAAVLQIDAVRLAFGVIGAAVLVALGCRTLWSAFRVRSGLSRPLRSRRRGALSSPLWPRPRRTRRRSRRGRRSSRPPPRPARRRRRVGPR